MNHQETQSNLNFIKGMIISSHLWIKYYREAVADYREMGDMDGFQAYYVLLSRAGEAFKLNKRHLKETVRKADLDGYSQLMVVSDDS